jgi:hypothetical protein
MNQLKGSIIDGSAENEIEALPFTNFVLTDLSNIIELCEDIVKIVNQESPSFQSMKISNIKSTIFQTYSLLMNETRFILLRHSSLFTINR